MLKLPSKVDSFLLSFNYDNCTKKYHYLSKRNRACIRWVINLIRHAWSVLFLILFSFLWIDICTWLGSPLIWVAFFIWVIVRFARLSSFLYIIAIFILSNPHTNLSLVRFTLPNSYNKSRIHSLRHGHVRFTLPDLV